MTNGAEKTKIKTEKTKIKNQIMEECFRVSKAMKRGSAVFNCPDSQYEHLYKELVKEGKLVGNPLGDGYILPEDHDATFAHDGRGDRINPITRDKVTAPDDYKDDTAPLVTYGDGAILLDDRETIRLKDGTEMKRFEYYKIKDAESRIRREKEEEERNRKAQEEKDAASGEVHEKEDG